MTKQVRNNPQVKNDVKQLIKTFFPDYDTLNEDLRKRIQAALEISYNVGKHRLVNRL